MTLLKVDSLSVDYGRKRPVHAIRNVSLEIGTEEFVGLVGESGCGKSTLGFAIARLERSPAHIVNGEVWIDGQCWTQKEPDKLRKYRWDTLAVVLQSGMNALNPVMTIARQFRDVMVQHTLMTSQEIRRRSEEVLGMVHIPATALDRYPHELSGGMRQRVAIAMALLLKPKLIIMDEPTTALDMVVQRQIVENLKMLRKQESFSVIFISHDLGLILELADRVIVMYAGEIVEDQTSANMLRKPMHPYTRALLKSMPNPEKKTAELISIPGSPPDLHVIPKGCLFAERCPLVQPICTSEGAPSLEPLDPSAKSKVRCYVTSKEVSLHV